MSARDKRQDDAIGPLIGISDEAAPVLNVANDNQQGARLIKVSEDDGFVACVQPAPSRSRGTLAVLAFAAAALVCGAGWLYVVSATLLDNVTRLIH